MAFLIILIIIAAAGGAALFYFKGADKGKRHSWLQFYARGKDAGFSIKEIELLRRLAVKSSLEEPSALFFSQNQLDICIRSLVKGMNHTGGEEDKESHDFLSKLYDFRKKIEMNRPVFKNGIKDSRQISDGQNLRILVKGVGVFKSQIIRNSNQSILISRPVSTKTTQAFSWTGTNISVYFWRLDDAGYVFDTVVEDEVVSKGLSSLKLTHSQSLFRTQKRKSIRLKINKASFLYLVSNEDDAHKLEVDPGLKCYLKDISETGCAVAIGGKAADGMRIKIQFAINNNPVVMPGTVRSVDYSENQDQSLLHVEADALPIETRNLILGEIFGMLPDDEEDLPFRILDEEVEHLIDNISPGNMAVSLEAAEAEIEENANETVLTEDRG